MDVATDAALTDACRIRPVPEPTAPVWPVLVGRVQRTGLLPRRAALPTPPVGVESAPTPPGRSPRGTSDAWALAGEPAAERARADHDGESG